MNYPYRYAAIAPAAVVPEVALALAGILGDAAEIAVENLRVALSETGTGVASAFGGCGAATEVQVHLLTVQVPIVGAALFVWRSDDNSLAFSSLASVAASGQAWGWSDSIAAIGVQRIPEDFN